MQADCLSFIEVNTMRREQVINWDPDILGGTPVFAGTRVPVQTLIDYLKAGDSLDDFLEGFPSVSREQAQAFLELALDSALAEARDARAA
jgi:uncharacterized protein (DUF433 family)